MPIMLKSLHSQEVATLLTRLRILGDEARARAELKMPDDGFLPDYWYGVAKGCDDAIALIETLLHNAPLEIE